MIADHGQSCMTGRPKCKEVIIGPWQVLLFVSAVNLMFTSRRKTNNMNSEASVLVTDDAKPEAMLSEGDSDSSPLDRPTTLSLDSTHDSNDEPCESLNAEESSVRRSVSNVDHSSKFRLRDISPSRLRERRKGRRSRQNSNTDSKSGASPRKSRTGSSWLPASFQQMFPSYKSKTGDFKRLFKDVPETEKLITDYSCALQRDILVHGRLYVSQNWLCFYANIFGWETLVTISIKYVTSLTKEKTALVIPNAIQVWTETEKYFFTSFVSRDSSFRSVRLIWQNVLSDKPMYVSTLMKEVGKYVDVDSEELETSSRCSNDDLQSDFDDIMVDENNEVESLVDSEDPHSNDSPKETKRSIEGIDQDSRNGIEPPNIAVLPASPAEVTEEIASAETKSTPILSNGTVPRESSSKASRSSETRRRFPFPFKKELSPLMRRKKQPQLKSRTSLDSMNDNGHQDSLMEDGSVSDSNEDENERAPVLCPCESHFALECINEEYVTDVDTMYEYLFTDCDFYRSMRAARKDFDLDIEPWAEVDNEKHRSVKYTINLNLTIGPKNSKIEEKQELKISEPGQYYVVESSVINGGIPYSDSFLIVQRYCLTRVNAYMCRLRVTATVKYVRPVWGFVKSMITKNSTEGLSSFFDFLKDFIRTAENESMIGTRQRLSSPRKHPNPIRSRLESAESNSDEEKEGKDTASAASTSKVGSRISIFSRRQNNCFLTFFTFLLVLLVVLNVYFGYRVISLERSTKSWESLGMPSMPSEWPTDLDEFRNLLYKQQYVQNLQLKRWQQVLSTSMQFLQQVQDSLKEIQKEVEKPLNEG